MILMFGLGFARVGVYDDGVDDDEVDVLNLAGLEFL